MNLVAAALLAVTPIQTPIVTGQADCSSVTITTSGLPDNAVGYFGLNDEPPLNAPINDSFTYEFHVPDIHQTWFVTVTVDGATVASLDSGIDCTPTPATTTTTTVASEAEPLPLEQWAGVALAPPW